MPSTRRRRAVTLIDLLVVLVILAVLTPAVLQAGGRSRETANRVKCGSNLRQIGQGILLYANENKGVYPRTLYEVGTQPTQYTAVHAPNPFKTGGPGPNDVTAALFLLIRTQDMTPEVFICASSDCEKWDYDGKDSQQVSNFPGEKHLSYSFANPYADATAVGRGYRLTSVLGADFAVAADMNPGKGGGFDIGAPTSAAAPQAQMQKANSRNHQGAGQNVLFGDGHVDFVQNPFVGVNRDNIYTMAGGSEPNFTTTTADVGLPRWAGDSVLLPVATRTPSSAGAIAAGRSNFVLIVGGVVLLIGIGVAIFLVMLRKPKPVGEAYAYGPPPPLSSVPQGFPNPPDRRGPPPLPPPPPR